MKLKCLSLFVIFPLIIFAQNSFELVDNNNSEKIHFRLLSNLMVVKVLLNGEKKNFILDSGATNNIYFYTGKLDTLNTGLHRKIRLKGIGGDEEVDGVVTFGNNIHIENFHLEKANIILVNSETINFSNKLGIPIHGILGVTFFKNHLIYINYKRKYIKIYNRFSGKKPSKKYRAFNLKIKEGKPFIDIKNTAFSSKLDSINLLIDTGSSDALWLIDNNNTPLKGKYFNDFLGKSLSGNIYGKKSYVEGFSVGPFHFKSVLAAFVNKNDLFFDANNRQGSIGGELLKRFYVYFDFSNKKIYLKKNRDFKSPFLYNISGIEYAYNGDIWVYEKKENKFKTDQEGESFFLDYSYTYKKRPSFVIEYIRPNSPASQTGLQIGDVISGINSYDIGNLSSNKLDTYLLKKSDITIKVEVLRNNKYFAYSLDLFKQL